MSRAVRERESVCVCVCERERERERERVRQEYYITKHKTPSLMNPVFLKHNFLDA